MTAPGQNNLFVIRLEHEMNTNNSHFPVWYCLLQFSSKEWILAEHLLGGKSHYVITALSYGNL